MNNLDDLIKIIRATFSDHTLIMRCEPHEGKSQWVANLVDGKKSPVGWELGKSKFPVKSSDSMLHAVTVCYHWACAYLIHGTVITDVDTVVKALKENALDKS